MKREEIEKASNKYIESYLKSSNEYPLCDNRKRMSLIQVDLYKMQEAFENGMEEADRTMLDRAEDYLRSKLEYRPILKEEYIHGEDYIRRRQEQSRLCNEFITAFRQAMEGGAE